MDYTTIPTVVFSHPAIGTVGLTEDQAIKEYGQDNIKIYKSSFCIYVLSRYKPSSRISFQTHHAGADEKVVGLHGLGYGVDEMIQGFAVAIKMGATKRTLMLQ